jgi:hypothetical protein
VISLQSGPRLLRKGPEEHRHVSLVMLAFAMMAAIRHHANAAALNNKTRLSKDATPDLLLVGSGNPCIAIKLTQKRIQPAQVIAWSLWRRAHQAEARRADLKRKSNCNGSRKLDRGTDLFSVIRTPPKSPSNEGLQPHKHATRDSHVLW